jgi:hypothetical protein
MIWTFLRIGSLSKLDALSDKSVAGYIYFRGKDRHRCESNYQGRVNQYIKIAAYGQNDYVVEPISWQRIHLCPINTPPNGFGLRPTYLIRKVIYLLLRYLITGTIGQEVRLHSLGIRTQHDIVCLHALLPSHWESTALVNKTLRVHEISRLGRFTWLNGRVPFLESETRY